MTPNFPRGALARSLAAVEFRVELAGAEIVAIVARLKTATRKPVLQVRTAARVSRYDLAVATSAIVVAAFIQRPACFVRLLLCFALLDHCML